ncbi:general transcription factor II-I repeat domain-containing protein 2-like [Watersipora subatra]|uniref:general transcription factor II-I repeat domain-containing protein 2-like n=1 Tax=Watersipora subatra TaxID=2589382 RepID=UPI00355B41CF
MASTSVDRKNRSFNTDWTEKFFFHEVANKPVYLICSKTISINKRSNLTRHYNTNHSDYDGRYPTRTVRRKEHLQKLLQRVCGQKNMIKSATSIQKICTAASYQVAHILGKAMAPYNESETIKECMLNTVKTLFPDKKYIHEAIQEVQLSSKTTTNRMETIAEHLTKNVVNDLKECTAFSIALDESTDINDVAQLCIFVRYFANNAFQEEFWWLSKDEALSRVWMLRNELDSFLSETDTEEANTFLKLLRSEQKMVDMAFLVDFLSYMNDLNVKLQGDGKDVIHLWQTISAYQRKLEVFHNDIVSDLDPFTTLKGFMRTLEDPDIVDLVNPQTFISYVIDEMNRRFKTFNDLNSLIDLFACPDDKENHKWKQQLRTFMVKVSPASMELELCKFLSDSCIREQNRTQAPSLF